MITHIGCISRGVTGYTLDSSRSSRFSYMGPLREEGKGKQRRDILLADVSSSSPLGLCSIQVVAGLGLMLPTTAEMTAPAALAPSASTCSTCKADRFTGHSETILPFPHHLATSPFRNWATSPKILMQREAQRSQDGLGQTSEADTLPFPWEGQGSRSLPPSEPFCSGSASRVGLRMAQLVRPSFYIPGIREPGRGAHLDSVTQ